MSAYDPERDLYILRAMAQSFATYLIEDELFWPISGRLRGGMPRLTIGGYLLREHRLTALRDSLTPAQQATLDDTLAIFHTARAEWTHHFFRKLEREWEMRLHLLGEFVRDCDQNNQHNCFENWPPEAENRTIAHHLLATWREHTPALREAEAALLRVDAGLRRYLSAGDSGEFLWPSGLEEAYPRREFWWLWVVPPEDTDEGY
ncbi:MAG: hypothetical protein JXN59_11470 [Anaerolineae bacterium]|nr:hypothetical protein [Anaerolineae bacterium]